MGAKKNGNGPENFGRPVFLLWPPTELVTPVEALYKTCL